ncbi:hypothetical protein HNW13_020085 [Shewanella sp. BF02_Schw]|uniref:hypothetical protein n=1 Tax=Shewanella sp. BF02_Schw TaxID=394908 RepID=UPI00177F7F73|nr:hypothetical protein [Shewanella sp. BF02_Schw]MBO1898044.1 hypothetical protein [Shewanella sp. BF02_Schw]
MNCSIEHEIDINNAQYVDNVLGIVVLDTFLGAVVLDTFLGAVVLDTVVLGAVVLRLCFFKNWVPALDSVFHFGVNF